MNPFVKNGNKLRWKFENVSKLDENGLLSDVFKTGPVEWKTGIKKEILDGETRLIVSLNYVSPNKNEKNWICEVDAKYNGNMVSKSTKNCYHVEKQTWAENLKNWKTYVHKDSIFIDIDFNFKYYDFSKNTPNYTDVMITVEDTYFYLNKSVLAKNSSHFADLLNSGDKNLKIENVKSIHFCYFLASLNPIFNTDLASHYKQLIKLAKNWGVPALHQKLEQFLISFSGIELIEKIKLADENDYDELMENALNSIGSSDEVKALQRMVEFDDLKASTKLRMYYVLIVGVN